MSRLISGPGVVKFADFELDLRSGELSRNGSRAVLAQQPFRLLLVLIREPGTVVTREDLQHELWPGGTFVDFELSLNAAVKRLREALGDSASSPQFIETLPRRGYRFIAPVHDGSHTPDLRIDPAQGVAPIPVPPSHERAESPSENPSNDAENHPLSRASWTDGRNLVVPALKSALVVVAVGGLIAFTFSRWATHEPAGKPHPKITRVTNVGTVRLASLSPDGEYLAYVRADGVRESLWIRKVDEPNPVQLLEPVHGTFRSLTLGGDGFVYYTLFRPTLTAAALHRLSIEDRSIEKISDAAAGVALSLDERILPVPPLPVEDATTLFAERAKAGRPDFDLDHEPVGAVAEICRRLDGLPLAIELAAARMRAMSSLDVARRLDRLRLLSGGARDAPPGSRALAQRSTGPIAC